MRIISGTHKGRRIVPDKSFKARPTTDFAKENLFNVLNNIIYFEDLEVLDLFGGTGGISYEFASRGAKKVNCVELNFKHASFIRKTAMELNFNQIEVIRGDIFKYLKSCKKKFDLIFADPPYDLPKIDEVPEAILSRDILKKDGLVIVEHSSHTDFSHNPYFFEKRTYGSVNFSFFKLRDTETQD
ncbi:MAG: RsmD family RNA methyltransferase [Marinifilaceae bacterium]